MIDEMIKTPVEILIIDDDETILDSITQVFQKDGYRTDTAENGIIGLEKLKSQKPDLVFLDLKMPGKDGMEVLDELHQLCPDCLAIVITGYATIDAAVKAMKQGAYDFLRKPFTPDELRLIARRGLKQRQAIRETKRLREEKELMRRNFVSMVSHELKSPLSAVQQNLIVIEEGIAGDIPTKAQKLLKRMQIRIMGLLSLINDWLDLSRIESGEMIGKKEEVHIEEVIKEVVDMLQPLADERKVRIQCTMTDNLPLLPGDAKTLQLLFTNLVQNGIKYNHEGGSVEISPVYKDHKVTIHVKDTGIGIEQDKLPMIFEQFVRLKNGEHIEGSGLGLCIVKKIIEAHSGTISVTSELGKGSVFTVMLPVKQPCKENDSAG